MDSLSPDERVCRIAAFIAAEAGVRPVEVSGLRRLAGGSSRQVWALDVTLGSEPAPERLELVLRISPAPPSGEGFAGAEEGFEREFRLLQRMRAGQVPVPRVYWASWEREQLGGPFYLMDRIEGETIPRRILRSEALEAAREQLPEQLGRALARVHLAGSDEGARAGLPGPAPGQTAAASQVAQLRAGIDLAPSPSPALELAHRWLERNLPRQGDQTLVHGDFRMGNIVVGPDGLRAILDWELAHVGDPHEDLAWMCTKTWRFGRVERPVGGVGLREPFYAAYEAESGRRLDREGLHFWEVLCSVRVAVVWIFQVRAYLSGRNPSVEQAVIGRRMSETELDLIELLT